MSDAAGAFVYRYYDVTGRLLYVGRTKNPMRRLREHVLACSCDGLIASVGLERHENPAAAAQAESHAIASEAPFFNVHYNGGPS